MRAGPVAGRALLAMFLLAACGASPAGGRSGATVSPRTASLSSAPPTSSSAASSPTTPSPTSASGGKGCRFIRERDVDAVTGRALEDRTDEFGGGSSPAEGLCLFADRLGESILVTVSPRQHGVRSYDAAVEAMTKPRQVEGLGDRAAWETSGSPRRMEILSGRRAISLTLILNAVSPEVLRRQAIELGGRLVRALGN